MSILHKLFGGQPVQAAPVQVTQPQVQPQQQQPTPGNIPTTPAVTANPNNPTSPADTANPNPATPTGLDAYKDMWNIPADQMPKAPESAFAGITPEAIKQVAGKTDFSKVVTPEMMTAISAGGEQAAAAMLTALNSVAQDTYAKAAESSMQLIDVALAKRDEQFKSMLPDLIKTQTVSNNLRSSNPIFNHPAASPMLDMFQKQLQLKNPTASAEQIQRQAEEFLISFANTANPPKVVDANKGNKTDWSDFE